MELKVGMMMYDNSPEADLAAKVRSAAAFYQLALGRAPNACIVNPSMLGGQATITVPLGNGGAVEVAGKRFILPNHLWLGVGEGGQA